MPFYLRGILWRTTPTISADSLHGSRSAISQERQRRGAWIGVRAYPAQHPSSKLVNRPTAHFPGRKATKEVPGDLTKTLPLPRPYRTKTFP
ncbi:uncharacterized protein [Dermacentor andersoni]